MGKPVIEFGVSCPHCREQLTIPLYLDAGAAVIGTPQSQPTRELSERDKWMERLDDAERDLLGQMERDGVVETYRRAYQEQSGASPGNPSRSMWGFFTRCSEARLPEWAKKRYRSEHRAATLTAFVYNGIVAVIIDGDLREFVPVRLLAGSTVKALGRGEAGVKVDPKPEVLDIWIKTRHGYIAAGKGSAFAQMMARRSVGDFADVRQ